MPLHKIIIHDAATKVLLWKITEDLQELFDRAVIADKTLFRLGSIKSEQHKKGILAVRLLLQHAGYSDNDLYYDAFGKPHLSDDTHISISHSHGFSSIILSDKITGIDLELRRDKIAIIAEKFIEPSSQIDKQTTDYISKLTVNWGVKEAVFKIRNEKGISFKDHIDVMPFAMDDKKTTAYLHFNNLKREFSVYFDEIEEYSLVYLFENKSAELTAKY
ncbi:MAG: 4-phosphopantetheinyl transferase [Flavobacterium sp.]|nr:MAG: 4-phosphopantetheinyl transferase [Flavobacterium sp.]